MANSTYNTINTLSRISVKPRLWSVTQIMGLYQIQATYVWPECGDWFTVDTARGQVKQYKSISAVMSDIFRVDLHPVISFDLEG